MRKIFLSIVLISTLVSSLYSQDWEYGAGRNKFEGFSYEFAGVQGDGEFPYTTPLFVVRKSDDYGIEVFLSYVNHGFGETDVKIVFDDDKSIQYRSSQSSDGETWFLKLSDNELEFLINKIKVSNMMYVRLKTSSTTYYYQFSMRGSSYCIEKLLGKKENNLYGNKI